MKKANIVRGLKKLVLVPTIAATMLSCGKKNIENRVAVNETKPKIENMAPKKPQTKTIECNFRHFKMEDGYFVNETDNDYHLNLKDEIVGKDTSRTVYSGNGSTNKTFYDTDNDGNLDSMKIDYFGYPKMINPSNDYLHLKNTKRIPKERLNEDQKREFSNDLATIKMLNSAVKEYQLGNLNENSTTSVEGWNEDLGDYRIISPSKTKVYYAKYKEDGKKTSGVNIVHDTEYNHKALSDYHSTTN